jgi:hypothetical protein
MARETEDEPLTPQRLRDELDEIAGLADALAIVSEDDSDRGKRAIGALANQISRSLDALYGEVHDALNDPTSFLGKRAARK